MQVGRRYGLFDTLMWTKWNIIAFAALSAVPVVLREHLGWSWLRVPWLPIALVGTAVAFYLGFKNNSSYERLWEARKIWGGIVNTSRAWTVAARDLLSNLHADDPVSEEELSAARRALVFRHLAWLHTLTLQMRVIKPWEHIRARDMGIRRLLGTEVTEESWEKVRPFLSEEEFADVRRKKNTATQILGLQSKALAELRARGLVDDFRHIAMQELLSELYTLQGKSERIKNFPFPRQYATVNFFFIWLFIALLPFGMVELFNEMGAGFVWLTVPFSTMVAWVFHTMEMIGDYSENPFEGMHNDVPILQIAASIEVDLRELIDDTDLPSVPGPRGKMRIVV